MGAVATHQTTPAKVGQEFPFSRARDKCVLKSSWYPIHSVGVCVSLGYSLRESDFLIPLCVCLCVFFFMNEHSFYLFVFKMNILFFSLSSFILCPPSGFSLFILSNFSFFLHSPTMHLSLFIYFPLAGSGYSNQQPGYSDFPNGPGTPTMGEFGSGPPPLSYQSDLPSGLLTPDKPMGHPMPGQVRVHHPLQCRAQDSTHHTAVYLPQKVRGLGVHTLNSTSHSKPDV